MSKIKSSIFLISTFFLIDVSYAIDTSIIRGFFITKSDPSATPNPANIAGTVLGILQWIGFFLAICITAITGIRFLTANAQQKAQLKDKLWLIVLGIIILAGSIPILTIIINAFESIRNVL